MVIFDKYLLTFKFLNDEKKSRYNSISSENELVKENIHMDKDGNLTATITVAILIGIMVTAYVGIAILASGSLVFPSVFNTDWSKMGSALYQLSANMINKKVAIISLVYNSLKIWFKGLTESIAKSFAKCKTKPRYRTPTEVHHIIAQKADAAKEARNIFCGKLVFFSLKY